VSRYLFIYKDMYTRYKDVEKYTSGLIESYRTVFLVFIQRKPDLFGGQDVGTHITHNNIPYTMLKM